MFPHAFCCAICLEYRSEHNVIGFTWFGDPVCEACGNTFEQCRGCQAVLSPHHVAGRDVEDEPLCPECFTAHAAPLCDVCGRSITRAEQVGSAGITGTEPWLICLGCTVEPPLVRRPGLHPVVVLLHREAS